MEEKPVGALTELRLAEQLLARFPNTPVPVRSFILSQARSLCGKTALPDVPRVEQCLWTRDPEHESGVFKTECGRMVCSEDEPEDWEATYCQYCGKPFKVENCTPEEEGRS